MKEEIPEHILIGDILAEALKDQKEVDATLAELHEALRQAEEELQLSFTEREEEERLRTEWNEFEREEGIELSSNEQTDARMEAHLTWVKDHIEHLKKLISSNQQLKERFDEVVGRLTKVNQDTLDILAHSKTGKPN